MLNGGKLQLNVELKSLAQRRQRQKGALAKAARLQLTEVIVEGALGAVLTDEAALYEGCAGGGRCAEAGRTFTLQQAHLAVAPRIVFLTEAGVAALT